MSMDWKANDRRSEAPQGDKTRISPSLIIGIVVAVLVVVFIVQNAKDSQVKFLFWDGTVSLWVVIVVSLILGAAPRPHRHLVHAPPLAQGRVARRRASPAARPGWRGGPPSATTRPSA